MAMGAFFTTGKAAKICFAFTIMLIILTIILSVLIVKPGLHGLKFKGKTVCTVVSSHTGDDVTCSCGRGCTSSFPCITIHVDYLIDGKNYSSILLHQNEVDFADFPQCSVEACSSSETSNNNKLRRFLDTYGNVGSVHDCFYNNGKPDEVILFEQYDELTVALTLAIPLTLSVIAIVINIIFCYIWHKNADTVPHQRFHNFPSRAI